MSVLPNYGFPQRPYLSHVSRKMTAEEMVTALLECFEYYQEHFGLPEESHLKAACEYEDKVQALMCKYRGHDLGPDQCNIPAHDFCYRCGYYAEALGFRRDGKGGYEKIQK